ncbi:MAG: Ig-like domain-containing protein, partial [Bacteroidota bacterium]
VAYGGNGFTTSNTVSGIIDRTSPTIFGPTSPVDKLLSFDDKAGISFSEEINYAISGSDVLSQNTRVYSSSDTLGYSDYTISVSGSSIEMYIDGQYISEHNGDTLFVKIDGIEDIYGNPLDEEIDWSFRLQQQDLKPVKAYIISPVDYIVNVDNKEEDILFVIANFDPNEFYSQLDTIYLEYKLASENNWRVADQLSKSTLLANYELLREGDEEFPDPIDTLVMSLSETGISDGAYQVRTATLGGNSFAYSSPVNVLVDRIAPSVQDFAPFDQIFSRGDAIGVSFNEDIDITQGIAFDVQGMEGSAYFEMIVSKGNLTFEPKAKFEEEIASLDGEVLLFTVTGVKDLAGNLMDPYQWSFTVDFFRIPPSPVRIKSPEAITVNSDPESQEVVVTIDGFELNNTDVVLDRITLEKQETGSEDWETFYVFTRDILDEQNQGTGILQATYTWMIDNSLGEGNYQLRAVSHGNGQFDYSNVVDITVDRIAPELVQFDPADGVFGNGDNIGFDFNESLLSTQLVAIDIVGSDGASVNDAFTTSQTSSGIAIQPIINLAIFDGEELTINLSGIFDEFRNELVGGVSKSFKVDYFSKPPSPVALVADDNFIINSNTEETLTILA